MEKLLAGHRGLTPESLKALLIEAAERLGPEPLAAAQKAGPARPAQLTLASGYRMFTDGASRGNPGEAGIGVVIRDDSGHIVKRVARYAASVLPFGARRFVDHGSRRTISWRRSSPSVSASGRGGQPGT